MLFEGNVDIYKYEILNRPELEVQFDTFASYFLAYRVGIRPKLEDLAKASTFMKYTTEWYKFIGLVKKQYDSSIGSLDVTFYTTYADIIQAYKFPSFIMEKNDYTLAIWGPRIWKFLHTTSILIADNTYLTQMFGCLMLNFDMMILCGICSHNYKRKNPLESVLLKIKYSNDPISVIYMLHNLVNMSLRKSVYNIYNFLTTYHLTRTLIKTVDYKEEINI